MDSQDVLTALAVIYLPRVGQFRVANASIQVYTCKVPGHHPSLLRIIQPSELLFLVGPSHDTRMLAVLTARGIGECFFNTITNNSDLAGSEACPYVNT